MQAYAINIYLEEIAHMLSGIHVYCFVQWGIENQSIMNDIYIYHTCPYYLHLLYNATIAALLPT